MGMKSKLGRMIGRALRLRVLVIWIGQIDRSVVGEDARGTFCDLIGGQNGTEFHCVLCMCCTDNLSRLNSVV